MTDFTAAVVHGLLVCVTPDAWRVRSRGRVVCSGPETGSTGRPARARSGREGSMSDALGLPGNAAHIPSELWDEPKFIDLSVAAKLLWLRIATAHPLAVSLALSLADANELSTAGLVSGREIERLGCVPQMRASDDAGTYWPKSARRAVLARDGGLCRYCGHPGATLDHVTPKSRGGSHGEDNLVTACAPCNSRKHDKTPEEAGMALRPLGGE